MGRQPDIGIKDGAQHLQRIAIELEIIGDQQCGKSGRRST
jgi:hypothetical protein